MKSPRSMRVLSLLATMALAFQMFFLLPAQPAMAQAQTGTIKGTVTDANGGVVAGATVTATNQATGVASPAFTTTGEGLYTIPNLIPGSYTITVEATGFKKAQVTDAAVKVGTEIDYNVVLQPGEVTETVTVVAGSENVVQTTSQISSSFETRKVEDLPSNSAGGGIDTLALLAPGVVPGFGNVNNNGTTLSVNGNRARSNNFTLDGTDNNDLTIGGPSFFVDNQDAVQEFQIVTNNYSAQYGRNQGAVVNIVTKSGTNEFHGSGFEFHRNSSALDAETNQERSDPGRSRRDKFISNVFGGTFGGPIKKNKSFFFFDGQLIRQRQTLLFQSGSPAITREGLATLAANFPGNAAIGALVNQNVFALQPSATVQNGGSTGNLCFPKDPTLACSGANAVLVPTGLPQYILPLPFDQKEYGLRGDVNLTNRDSFNVKYRYQQSPETNFNSQSNGFFGDIPFKSRNLNGVYTRQIGSRMVNEFKAAYQKLGVSFAGCTGTTDPLKGCISDTSLIDKAFTNITFTGIRASGLTMQSIGPATNAPQGRDVRVLQFADTLTYTVGRHSMLMGIDYRNLNNVNPFLPNINGAFRFSSTARIVANAPSFVTLVAGTPTITYKENDQFYYFQDDFKFRENLTLNLGVRYEYTGQPINKLNDITVARETNPSTAIWRQSLPLSARTVPHIPPDKNNWAPRVGFAWSPRWGKSGVGHLLFGENDATVIRGGYSIAYDPAFYNILLNVSTSSPVVFNNTINNNSSLTAPLFRLPANPTGDVVRSSLGSFIQTNTFDPRFFNETIVSSNFHSPYSQQWSLTFQRQVNRNSVFDIRYVGNHGIGLFQSLNRNPRIDFLQNGFTSAGFGGTTFTFPGFPNLTAGYTPLVCTDVAGTPDNEGACNGRILPQGLLRSRENTGQSIYHGLQMLYNGRLRNQFTITSSYTWSKTIDNASEIFSFGEGAFASNPLDPQHNERGLSGNDRRHAGTLSVIWDIPYFKKQEGFMGHVLGGWQINGVYILASGRPFTPSQFFGLLGALGYEDASFQNTFVGLDAIRPFTGNRNAPRGSVAITDVDASYFGFTGSFVPSSTGFYSLNELNRTGNLVAVTPNDVRFIFNGPGAARRFGNTFGNVLRNSERGPALNQLNLGFFKNTNLTEKIKVQFRAELFNALNHPNIGYGVAAGDTLPDTVVEDAGLYGINSDACPGCAGTNEVGFNDPRGMNLSSRRVQFGLRIIF